jgi:mannose-6-phosphate isomerase-like protein (cupin superfamily)
MDAFQTSELVDAQHRPGEHTYTDFFRRKVLSLGMSIWPAGGEDTQQPHTEDEVYVVMAGRGHIRAAGEDRPVQTGSVVYVATGVEHRFHSIEEDLHVPVLWAPPHRSREGMAAPGEAAAHQGRARAPAPRLRRRRVRTAAAAGSAAAARRLVRRAPRPVARRSPAVGSRPRLAAGARGGRRAASAAAAARRPPPACRRPAAPSPA